jgi:hypothetical protein
MLLINLDIYAHHQLVKSKLYNKDKKRMNR